MDSEKSINPLGTKEVHTIYESLTSPSWDVKIYSEGYFSDLWAIQL
jgi:hypothetical protein